jgi:N-acetyl-anhydromuramyl-L-alanine amidase AmpD
MTQFDPEMAQISPLAAHNSKERLKKAQISFETWLGETGFNDTGVGHWLGERGFENSVWVAGP